MSRTDEIVNRHKETEEELSYGEATRLVLQVEALREISETLAMIYDKVAKE